MNNRVLPPESFVPFPREDIELSIGECFQQSAERHGTRLAVRAWDGDVDYSELDRRANRVAHGLLDRYGDRPEPVATLLKPGLQGTVAALGILKAGKIWVPLDPSHPPARVEYMLEDSQAGCVLTDAHHDGVIEGHDLSIARLDVGSLAGQSPTSDLDLEVAPDACAYIIYTSGSTGQPKGIVQSHRNALHAAYLNINTFCMARDDRLPQFSSYGHISSVNSMFRALLAGAALFPVDVRTLDAFDGWLREHQISVFSGVPTLFRHLTDQLDPSCTFPSVRLVHLGGEVVSRRDIAAFKRHFVRPCLLLNNLGSTEVSIYRQFVVDHEMAIDEPVVPVGYPVEDKEVVLVDGEGDEVPAGELGEMVIKSPYLALGYWRRPELTHKSFKDDPDDPTRRVFRTGDLARMLPDGCLILAGRKDAQVKILGERIETGEVEAVLSEVSGVRACAVVATEEAEGHSLVAYVVPEEDHQTFSGEWRETLSQVLPDYMVPSRYVILEDLPLTPTGKVDRQALSETDETEHSAVSLFVAPSTELERTIADIWRDVLRVERVGIHDHFLDLGGNSLKAALVASRLGRLLKAEVPLNAILEQPTVAELAHWLADPRSWQAVTEVVPLTSLDRVQPVDLSFAQQRIWFLDQFEPGSAQYNLATAVRLDGVLNVDALKDSLTRVVERHESLRTRYVAEDGIPAQLVSEPVSVPLPLFDLQRIDADLREESMLSAVQLEARRPFDLSRDLMIRAALWRLSENQHVLLMVLHHISSDGWSLGLLFDELASLYRAHTKGEAAALPELPVQYIEFAVWQRKLDQTESFRELAAYWRRKLASAPKVLDLPTDRPRPAIQSYCGSRQTRFLPHELSGLVRDLCRRERVTFFVACLSAFQALLYKYTGAEDLLVGTTSAGRSRAECERLIGLFINPLVIRADLSGNPQFRELLVRTRETVLEAEAHRDFPFEKLVEDLRPDRDPSHSPLFQVMFVLQDARRQETDFYGLKATHLAVDRQTSMFDLTLFAAETRDGIRLIAEYNTDLFDADTIERILGHYETLLFAAASKPDERIDDLKLIATSEECQLLEVWNNSDVDFQHDLPIHALIEAQVARRSGTIAAVCDGEELTYHELNQKANQLARYLQRRGVGAGDLVGVCLERSLDALISLLAILKAGAAYVPLDPSFPAERLSFIVSDAGVKFSLVGEQESFILPAAGSSVLRVDQIGDQVARERTGNLNLQVAPNQLAYVMYTSGSTGRPKGVLTEHRAVVNFLEAMRREPGLVEDDVLLSVTTLSFDISVLELFLPLVAGARTVLTSREVAADGVLLARALKRHRATVMQGTPASWRLLLDAGWEGQPGLKMLCGGEAWSRELADLLLARGGELWNMYGPTETTVWSAVNRVEPNGGPVCIGHPIANTQLHVLDSRLQLVPIGVPGELYIGGHGLARGYHNLEGLTAERFSSDRFKQGGHARLYRTGDLVRRRPDGGIQFLGRLDSQVKVRGFRIELGEIEARLAQHPSVERAVVVSYEIEPGDRRLAAYLIPTDGCDPSAAGLRAHLREKLPAYMIPNSFMTLDAFPLTPNGKIDRKALPARSDSVGSAPRQVARACDNFEIELTRVWQEVLGLTSIGRDEDFFDLGGHSLLAVRLFSRIRDRFDVSLPLQTLFSASTVESLAEEIRKANGRVRWSSLVPIKASGSRPALYMVHAAGGNVLLYRDLASHLGSDQPVYGLQAQGLDGQTAFLTNFHDMAALYVSEVLSFQPSGPFYLGGYCLGGLIAYEMAQQLKEMGHEVQLVAMLETYYSRRRADLTPMRRVDRLLQNLTFHAENLFSLDTKGKATFIREKLEVAVGRARGRSRLLLSRFSPLRRVANDADSLYLRLTRENDRALRRYVAAPYSGRVVLFRPNRVFRGNEDPSFGWHELVGDHLEVRKLPIAPRGMLVEPLVRVLADQLRVCIDQTLVGRDVKPRQGFSPEAGKRALENPS